MSKDIVSTKSIATGTEYIIIFFKINLLKKNKKKRTKGIIKIRSLIVRERLVKKLRNIEIKANISNPKSPNSKIFNRGSIFTLKKQL